MALRFIEGFGQFQGMIGPALLTALRRAGYTTDQGVTLTGGRHSGTYALELQVSAGSAGTTWSKRDNGIQQGLRAVAHGMSQWVAVGQQGNIHVSADSMTWVACISPVTTTLNDVTFANGMWVAVGEQGTILTSEDGLNWTQRTAPSSNYSLKSVAGSKDGFVAVGNVNNEGVILYSADGIVWGTDNPPSGPALNVAFYHDDIGFLIGGDSGRLEASSDGTAWTPRSFGATANIQTIAYNGSVVAATAGTSVRRSTNGGVTWSAVTPNLQVAANALVGADGLWVALTGTTIRTSTDLSTWVQRATVTDQLRGLGVSEAPDIAWVAVGDASGGAQGMAAIHVSLAAPTTVTRTFTSEASRVTVGFAHKASARGRIASIAGVCDIDWPGKVEILGEQGNGVPIRNAWYYYELTIDKTNETITLHVNNTLDLTVPMPAEVQEITNYEVTWQVENGAIGQIGDIYFLDNESTNSGSLTERLGPIQVLIRLPDEDVLAEWQSTEDEQTPHWSVVGTPPPEDGRYIYSNLTGQMDLFTSSDPLPPEAGSPEMPILAVGLVALASKSDVDNRQLGLVLGDVGPDQKEVVDTELSLSPEYSYAVFEQAPGDVAWDENNVVTTPFGVVVRP